MSCNNYFKEFTKMYPVSKTLRFRLIPQGKTEEWIKTGGILEQDEKRAENYEKLKEIINRYHKDFLSDVLKSAKLEVAKIEEAYAAYYSDEKNKLEKCQENLRKVIIKQISSDERFKTLFKKELIRDVLPKYVDNEDEQNIIGEFYEFTTYLSGFFDNRKNMYSADEKSTSVAYRLINDNLMIFFDNYNAYQNILQHQDISELENCEKRLCEILGVHSFTGVFMLDAYNGLLTQNGIDIYNQIIGGISTKECKVKGIRQIINEYNQQHDKSKRIPQMKPLKKMILSDRESASFIPEKFANSEELLKALMEFIKVIDNEMVSENENASLRKIMGDFNEYSLEKIYVDTDRKLMDLSQKLFGDWSTISQCISYKYDCDFGVPKNESQEKKKQNYLKKRAYYSIKELDDMIISNGKERKLEDYYSELKLNIADQKDLIELVLEKENQLLNILKEKDKVDLIKDKLIVEKIKEYLDSIKAIQWYIAIFIKGDKNSNKDANFYAEIMRIWNILVTGDLLYNKIRNFVTQKPYSEEKIKLNFENSLLLNGWDRNKEKDNTSVILLKEEKYYLGIMNKKYRKIFENLPEVSEKDCYQKMIYKLLPGPNKMLPKVFLKSKTGVENYKPSDKIVSDYDNKKHIVGPDFDKDACHNIIDFFKKSLYKHEDWKEFNFTFSDTESYSNIGQFYKEVARQGYKVSFTNVSTDYVNELVEEGKLFLFQIYNKDFSEKSKGTPNLHTLYWKMLFDPDNLTDIVYKLNGQAEIFYRKASIKESETTIHKANKPIDNKNINNPKTSTTFEYDIIKNKRYTQNQYFLHVPITMNFSEDTGSYLNIPVREAIHNNKEQYVIGIDRGERNLLYVVMIDSKGKIVYQRSLNDIVTKKNDIEYRTDYHGILDRREDERRKAREQWKQIDSIKELKEGYLSLVIHEIVKLMTEYNAIVVLEDLNGGFKRSRQKVEKQVYQKFEKMLIDKLNYLVDDKSKEPKEPGGLLNAYQLTNSFESFQKLGKQSGVLFYVQAWNTSKIDPTTGFVNLLYPKYESLEKSRNFVTKFERISYNDSARLYEFDIDYKKFTFKADGTKEKWTLCSYGERIDAFRNRDINNSFDYVEVNLTEKFDELFEKYGIKRDGTIKEQILDINEVNFYKEFMHLIWLMLKMRNSDQSGNDYILSPVRNKQGVFFDSRIYDHLSSEEKTHAELPVDADANGAFNIARKGLWVCREIQNEKLEELGRVKLAISNKSWLQFVQELEGES